MRELFLNWALRQIIPVFFALVGRKSPIVRIIHSSTNYVGGLGVEDRPEGEVGGFFGELAERRDTTQVLIQRGKLTMLRNETMVPKDDTDTW